MGRERTSEMTFFSLSCKNLIPLPSPSPISHFFPLSLKSKLEAGGKNLVCGAKVFVSVAVVAVVTVVAVVLLLPG